MKICIVNILFCFLLLPATAADNYKLNDTLYVWAKNGLNLREQPDLKGKVIKTLEPGARVIVREITDKELTLNSGADSNYKVKQPYLLRGKWVLAETVSGQKGYLFDIYLLKIPTPENNVNSTDHYVFEMMKADLSLDTIWNPEGVERYESDNEFYKVVLNTNRGISISKIVGGVYSSRVTEIADFSIKEGFVFFMYLYPAIPDSRIKGLPFLQKKNWIDELVISFEICSIRFYKKGNMLVIEERCSC